jgi:hypothetical protein
VSIVPRRGPGSRRQPYRGGWPHPFASQPGPLREDANGRNSGNGDDNRE